MPSVVVVSDRAKRHEGIPYKLPKIKTIFDIKQFMPSNKDFVGGYNVLYYYYAAGDGDVFHRAVMNGSVTLSTSGEKQEYHHASPTQANQIRGNVEFRQNVSKLPLPFDAVSFSFSERLALQSSSENTTRASIPFSGLHPSMNEVPITGTLNFVGEKVAAPYHRDASCRSSVDNSTCAAILFPNTAEALIALHKYAADTNHSWLCNHMIVPSEIALLVRKFMYPAPVIFFNEGDLLFRYSWYDVNERKRRRMVLIAERRS